MIRPDAGFGWNVLAQSYRYVDHLSRAVRRIRKRVQSKLTIESRVYVQSARTLQLTDARNPLFTQLQQEPSRSFNWHQFAVNEERLRYVPCGKHFYSFTDLLHEISSH